jgi:PilZ domain-containing protein
MTTSGERQEGAPPEPGTDVWLDGPPGGPLTSMVTALRDGLVRIDPPRRGGLEALVPAGTGLVLSYRRHEVPHSVAAELAPAPAGEGGRGVWLRLLAPPTRLQRRAAVRVPVRLIARAAAAVPDGVAAGIARGGITEDLSATGAMVRTDCPLVPTTQADLAIDCGRLAGTVTAVATVVRCDRVARTRRPWRIAFAFTEIDRAQEERLVRFLFVRQRELRREALDRTEAT